MKVLVGCLLLLLVFILFSSASLVEEVDLDFTLYLSEEEKIDPGRIGREFLESNRVTKLEPIVLVPGLVGSALNAELNGASNGLACPSNKDPYRIWIDALQFADLRKCIFKNLPLQYDANTQTYSSLQGVNISPVDFGGVNGVNYLSNGTLKNETSYMQVLIESLERVGYIVGQNLAAAPYDWRYPYDGIAFDLGLDLLIENLYNINNSTKVHVLGHSMGNIYLANFLDKRPDEWKNKYINSFLSVAGPWSGASLALRTLLSGLSIKIGPVSVLNYEDMRSLSRTLGSVVNLLPDSYYSPGQVLVKTPSRNYTVEDFDDLFEILQGDNAEAVRQQYKVLKNNVAHMGLPQIRPTYCLYGIGKDTEDWYEYPTSNFDEKPIVYKNNLGDGVVPLQSLRKCQEMVNHEDGSQTKEFNLLGHIDLVKDPEFINFVINVITESEPIL